MVPPMQETTLVGCGPAVQIVVMNWIRTIVGAMAAVALTTHVAANPLKDRPISRQDALHARLASVAPQPRPPHMLRYPVQLETRKPDVRPVARTRFQPRARWDFKDGGRIWTRAAMSAISDHAGALLENVPRDIDVWCPAYADHGPEMRRAFWVGMMSALSKHESTYNPRAVGGPNLWYGLLQIYPDTARRYGCRARTGEALKDPAENLSCAARIMAVTVTRDNAVAVYDGRWRGVAADWGPMSNRRKISEMSAWTRVQSYCTPIDNIRPIARPSQPAAISTMTATPQPD